MRLVLAVLVGVVCIGCVAAQPRKAAEPGPRYGIAPDLKTFPQATPQEALASVLKAVETQRIDYLLAQLADPEFVDRRVRELGGKFDDLVREATTKLVDNPATVKQLQRLIKEGTWEVHDAAASAHLKDAGNWVYLRKQDGRWFMENRSGPEKEGK